MKTLTITLHDSYNCGSSLQAYALQHFLIKNNVENEIINYCPEYLKKDKFSVKSVIKKLIYYPYMRKRIKNFEAFRDQYLKITSFKCNEYDELTKNKFDADCYIAGSDQLWNSMYDCGNDPAYYLDFISGNKITYAVSMGREIIPNDNLELIKKYSKNDFKWISVRENSAIHQLAPIFDCTIDYVCDPVLLNDVDDYKKIESARMIDEPYIFVYVAQDIDEKVLQKLVSCAQKKFNAKVVFSGTYKKRCCCDYHIREASPSEFLSLIDNACCVISNSFHATMFSLIYKKQVYALLPDKNGERISSILELVSLDNHIIKDLEKINMDIINDKEYLNVENKLKIFQKNSQEKLLFVLKQFS